MNKLLLALTLAATLVGCSNSTSTKPVETAPAKVELSAGKIMCFEVAQEMQNITASQGLDKDHFVKDECGTDVEREAFKSGNYVKK